MIIDKEGDSIMADRNGKNGKNGKGLRRASEAPVKTSALGQKLREISDQALASGTRVLSIDEIHQLICEARGSVHK
jgi:hypothetical protein